ncbi:hypothetical protein PIB30_072459 [Stylosanthes scabra]|uniref:Uncharacterized protein n=1 Tax=Stylosanthes scabra TaxID=79078 RepID=A0ABU6XMH9_9FABA|nr:hypothetical protein [Stylosanthes scabra]
MVGSRTLIQRDSGQTREIPSPEVMNMSVSTAHAKHRRQEVEAAEEQQRTTKHGQHAELGSHEMTPQCWERPAVQGRMKSSRLENGPNLRYLAAGRVYLADRHRRPPHRQAD